MYQEITPIPVRPWTLNGLSEQLVVSHYENNYGAAVRTVNAIRAELGTLEARAPGYRLRALKRATSEAESRPGTPPVARARCGRGRMNRPRRRCPRP
jgi:hypothetical protein